MADDRISLVLNVSGVQDVAYLKSALEDLAAAMGVTDSHFEQMTSSAQQAAAAVDDLAEAAGGGGGGATPGGGGGGGGGKGGGGKKASGGNGKAANAILMLAQAMDDAQYGFRGIVNNVPGIVTALGLGTGVAGAAQMAAIFLNQVSDELSKLLAGEPKYKETLENVADRTSLWAGKLEFAKKQLAELAKEQNLTFESLEKYRKKLAEVTELEQHNRDVKRDAAAGEKAAADPGVAEKELMAAYQQAFQDQIIDTGESGAVTDQIKAKVSESLRARFIEAGNDPVKFNAVLREFMMKDPQLREMYQRGVADKKSSIPGYEEGVRRGEISPDFAERAFFDENRNKLIDTVQSKIDNQSTEAAKALIGRMANPKSSVDFDNAFKELQKIAPTIAFRVWQQYKWAKEDKVLDEELEKFKASNQQRRRDVAEFERNEQGPGLGTTEEQRDANNQNVQAENRANQQRRINEFNEARAKQNELRRDQEVDQARTLAGKMIGDNTMEGILMNAWNQGNRKNRGRNVAQVQEMISTRLQQENKVTGDVANEVAGKMVADAQERLRIMRQNNEITLNNVGQLVMTVKGMKLENERYRREMNATLQQIKMGVRQPGWQGGMGGR